MRVAALYDIHGNLPALEAVLADLERDAPDLVVTGGDVASGPFPHETIALLTQLRLPAAHVMGNADRELFTVAGCSDCASTGDDPMAQGSLWAARQLSEEDREFLASFVPTVTLDIEGLGRVMFCHGSPFSDEESITIVTSDERLSDILAGVTETTIVCGHTHSQFDRSQDGIRVINAGSVGMPYEDRPGAYWAWLGPDVQLRRTEYDLERAARLIRSSAWPPGKAFAAENIVTCPGAKEAAVILEPPVSP